MFTSVYIKLSRSIPKRVGKTTATLPFHGGTLLNLNPNAYGFAPNIAVDATDRSDARFLVCFGRFHLGTKTEAAKYRRRVPSASRELATLLERLSDGWGN